MTLFILILVCAAVALAFVVWPLLNAKPQGKPSPKAERATVPTSESPDFQAELLLDFRSGKISAEEYEKLRQGETGPGTES